MPKSPHPDSIWIKTIPTKAALLHLKEKTKKHSIERIITPKTKNSISYKLYKLKDGINYSHIITDKAEITINEKEGFFFLLIQTNQHVGSMVTKWEKAAYL
jgi:hypothetical protein